MKFYSLIFILLFFIYGQAVPADFYATAKPNPVSSGERFQVTFTINGEGSNFKPPSFRNFKLLQGPSTSQRMFYENGKMSRTMSYSYVLETIKEGNFTIGPATIKTDGGILKTAPITVQVVPPSKRQLAEREKQKQQNKDAMDIIKNNLFAKLTVNKKNVYIGEQILATVKLYRNPDLGFDNKGIQMPVFDGFWTQDITGDRINWKREVINGTVLNVATVKKVILIPQQPGKLTIQPFSMDVVAQLRVQSKGRRSMFDDFFGRNYKNFDYSVKSNSASINVKELPEPQPANFTNGVGRLKIETWFDKTKTKTNDPVTLKIKISGNGNLKLINPPEISLPPDFEVYDPKISDNINVNSSGMSGSRTIEYLMIPRHPGEFEIGPVELSYFDVPSMSYKKSTSDQFKIEVAKGKGGSAETIISGVDKEEIKYLGKDIRFIKSNNARFTKGTEPFFGSIAFYGLWASPLLLFIIIVFYKRKKDKLNSDKALMRNRAANKMARKRLSEAKKFLKEGDRDKFYEEIARALWGYLSDKLGIPVSDLTKDTTAGKMNAFGIPENKTKEILNTLESCEYARFAPESEELNMDNIYKDSASHISDIERMAR